MEIFNVLIKFELPKYFYNIFKNFRWIIIGSAKTWSRNDLRWFKTQMKSTILIVMKI